MTSPVAMWKLQPTLNADQAAALAAYPPVIRQLLVNRGLETPEAVQRFIEPDYDRDSHDPFLFRDMGKVLTRIATARDAGQRVVVHGDYDADGVCASVVLMSLLQELGFDDSLIDVYIPHRATEGYGLNVNTIEQLASQGTKLIITCDCGITNVEEITRAAAAGIDVIVTDHHLAPTTLPPAFAMINPNVPGETYPFKQLSGTGVAFKVVQAAVQKKLVSSTFAKWLLDLVAIGTVTDFMPLRDENRTLVSYGLTVLRKTQRPGLQALLGVMNRPAETVTTSVISFGIGPRLNAAGRLNHANLAYNLFMASGDEAVGYARELDAVNKERQTLGETIAKAVIDRLELKENQPNLIFAYDPSWPGGVVGAVASRLAHEYHRPTIIVGRQQENITGSGRSIVGVNITDLLHRAHDRFERLGGHPMACGFTLKADSDPVEVGQKLQALLGPLDPESLVPTQSVEADMEMAEVTWPVYEVLAKLEPFGEGNPRPIFRLAGVTVVDFRTVGSDGQHLRLTLRGRQSIIRPAIGFRLGEWAERLTIGDELDCLVELEARTWNGQRELQLKIVDLRLAA